MAEELRLDTGYTRDFVPEKDLKAVFPEVEKAHSFLGKKSGPGNDYLGWTDLPEKTGEELIGDIEDTARALNRDSDAIVVVGIGGSYLGARAAIESLAAEDARRRIFFAGHNISCEYLSELLRKLRESDVSVNVVSKSGTTTEPAISFRIIEDFMRKKYGPDKVRSRIVCTTDREKGALRTIAEKRGYKTFVIPDDVGGRFSVLTPVGLLPIACAGIDIKQLLSGARQQRARSLECDPENNLSCKYAAIRNCMYRKGKKIEIFASFSGKLRYVDEWWKQLFGESEGKDGRGIFPASCEFSTDLHSMGQLIQQGERNIFETFLVIENEKAECKIPRSEDDLDGLNYLAGKELRYINRKAYEATAEAHYEGGVPNMTVFMPERSAFALGQLFYFFERAVAVSAYISGVNPFNQPGVEAYKRKMFKLLGKPGA